MKILVVEDERQLCDDIAEDLELERYTVERCYDGLEAWERILVESYDLVILDLNLPGMDGLDILRSVRREKPELRVLILSARSSLANRVEGLDLGADDYLTKPFAAEELLARIRALARRPVQWEQGGALKRWDLELDVKLCTLQGPGGSCSLSKRESRLLEIFLRNAGQTMTRELLLARVWGPDAPVEEGNLDNYIHFLRRRLSAVGSGARIVTVRGVGYRLEEGA